MTGAVLSPAELVGLLADDDRLAVVAALVLGNDRVDEIGRATGLDTRRVVTALARLVGAGLVVRDDDGAHHLVRAAFSVAARAAGAARPGGPPHGSEEWEPERARVVRAFVRDGRLLSIPAAHAKRLVVLDLLAQEFEPGRRYTEAMVNLILGRWHPDTAALRRHLVDDGFLSRAGGEYWRSGGTVRATRS